MFLIADQGYSSYASILETSQKLVRENPDLVQRFVDASIEGWYSYIYGDPKPGNDLIKKDNPDESDDLLAYAIAQIKQYGIVDSGNSEKDGIGTMTDARWKDFFDVVSEQGLYPKDMNYRAAYTLHFVNRRVGMELKK